MVDIKKVLFALEMCSSGICTPNKCPYSKNDSNCDGDLMRDALSILKEQEPVKPRKKKDKEWGINRWSCGNCGYNVGYPHMAYFCSKCGKPINWY